MISKRYFLIFILGISLLPYQGQQFTTIKGQSQSISIEPFVDITFDQPVELRSPSFTEGIYVVERSGKITFVLNDISEEILNIESKVDDSGGEMGLLGLAFHPNFTSNGYVFVDYTTSDPRRTIISRFEGNTTYLNPNSEKIILEVEQPYSNHNAGSILFGPDGMLYITLGDGGSGGDPLDNGQDPSTLLGSILRVDINTETQAYLIPEDNPFVGHTSYRGEVFAYGLRNPWKLSYDNVTDTFIAGDVGQNKIEEIDRIEKGLNYGWNEMEGTECYVSNCNTTGKVLPLTEYSHDVGNSITGGYVNRNSQTTLFGWYIFGDFGTGKIFGFEYDKESDSFDHTLLLDTDTLISTFGLASDGNVLLADYGTGTIYKIIGDEFLGTSTSSTSGDISEISDTTISSTASNSDNTPTSDIDSISDTNAATNYLLIGLVGTILMARSREYKE